MYIISYPWFAYVDRGGGGQSICSVSIMQVVEKQVWVFHPKCEWISVSAE